MKVPQPWSDRKDEEKRELFLKGLEVLSNDSWHKKLTINFYGWHSKFLPPYSPDFNPIKRIWNTMKARWFNNFVCKNAQQLINKLDLAILDVIDNPKRNQKIAAIGTLF